MLRFIVIGMNLDKNQLALNYKGRVIYFSPKCPVFYFRMGQVIRIPSR